MQQPTTTNRGRRLVTTVLGVVALSALVGACGVRPAPPPAPTTVQRAINQAFGPYGQAAKATRVARCESGLNAMAGYPSSYYKGLFQLGPHVVAIRHYGGNWFDPYQNAAAARDLFVTRGNWSAWPYCGRA